MTAMQDVMNKADKGSHMASVVHHAESLYDNIYNGLDVKSLLQIECHGLVIVKLVVYSSKT